MDFGARHLHWYWRQTSFQKDNGHTESWHLCPNGALNLGIQRRMPFGIVGLHACTFVTILISLLLWLRSIRAHCFAGKDSTPMAATAISACPGNAQEKLPYPRSLNFF